MTARPDGRAADELRPVRITTDFTEFAEGSVLIEVGRTRVLCTASVEDIVPPWLRGRGQGWLTAEYAMLPRATDRRTRREVNDGRVGGRTQEIQRLIGRSLRMAAHLDRLGERTITIDCDVLQADGGTRTAAITGGYVALALACRRVYGALTLDAEASPLRRPVAAVSVGLVDGEPRLDLAYAEDSRADADLNVVMDGAGAFIEVQGTGEHAPFGRAELDRLLDLAAAGITRLLDAQQAALAG